MLAVVEITAAEHRQQVQHQPQQEHPEHWERTVQDTAETAVVVAQVEVDPMAVEVARERAVIPEVLAVIQEPVQEERQRWPLGQLLRARDQSITLQA